MAKLKKLPDMSDWTAKEVHEFWKMHSSADYCDQTEEVEVEVARHPHRPISVKLSEQDLKMLKRIARDKGLGYTTLLRIWIEERLHEEAAPL